MSQDLNWYQQPAALFTVSVIVAAALVGASWDWEKVFKKDIKHFCFSYTVQAPENFVVTNYDAEEHNECEGKGPSGSTMVRVELRGRTNVLDGLKTLENEEGWLPLHRALGSTYDSETSEIPVTVSATDLIKQLTAIDKKYRNLVVVGSKNDTEYVKKVGETDLTPHIDPDTVSVEIEQMETRTVSVKAITKGEPADGYRLIEPVTTSPEEVEIRVPQSKTEENVIKTAPISVHNLNTNKVLRDARLVLPAFSELVGNKEPYVSVELRVEPERKTELLEPLKITLKNATSKKYRVRAVPEYIALQVRMDVQEDAGALQRMRAQVDVRKAVFAENDTSEVEVKLSNIPRWVNRDEDIDWRPKSIRLVREKIVNDANASDD